MADNPVEFETLSITRTANAWVIAYPRQPGWTLELPESRAVSDVPALLGLIEQWASEPAEEHPVTAEMLLKGE